MANFLTTSSPAAVATEDANAQTIASANRRNNAAYNALTAAYGPQAGNPEAWQNAVAADTASKEQADNVNIKANQAQVSDNTVTTSNLDTDQKQRADTAWQGHAVAQYVKAQGDAVDPDGNNAPARGAAYAKALTGVQSYLPQLGVDAAHVQPFIDHLQQNPAALNGVIDSLTPAAKESKIQGAPIYSVGADGKPHIGYAQQDGSYQEIGLPAGQSVTMSPAQQAAAAAKADTTSAAKAAFTTDLKAEDVSPMITSLIPGATITGMGRTPARNAAVGGVPNSMHLSDQAIDFVAPPGSKLDNVVAKLRAQGVPVTEAINEGQKGDQGPHFHIGWAPKPGKGGGSAADLDPNASASDQAKSLGVNQNALDIAAQTYLTKGTLPNMGMQGAALKTVVMNRAGELAGAVGMDANGVLNNQQEYKNRQSMLTGLGKTNQGSAGAFVAQADALTNHLETLKSIAGGLAQGNAPIVNQAANWWAKNTGQAAPTTFPLARALATQEADKFITGNPSVAGAKEIRDAIATSSSPAQMQAQIATLQGMAAAQLNSRRLQYSSHGLGSQFDAQISPVTKAHMGIAAPPQQAAAASDPILAKYGL